MDRNKTKVVIDVKDRDVNFDWYNAHFRVEFELRVKADGTAMATDTTSAPVNGSFSLIKALKVQSAGKRLFEANGVHKVVFIKNLLEVSDDYARKVAKDEFWYLNNDNTTVTDNAATNLGIRKRALLSQGDPQKTIKTITPSKDIRSSRSCLTNSSPRCRYSLTCSCRKTKSRFSGVLPPITTGSLSSCSSCGFQS